MEIEFYDVKTRKKVAVPLEQIRRVKLTRQNKDGSTQVRFALKGSFEGRTLMKLFQKWTTTESRRRKVRTFYGPSPVLGPVAFLFAPFSPIHYPEWI